MPRSYRLAVRVEIDASPMHRPLSSQDAATDRRMTRQMVDLSRRIQRRLSAQVTAAMKDAIRHGWQP